MRFDAFLDRPGLRLALSPLLLPASALYAFGLHLDRALSSSRRRTLAVPTISVGNLTVGGTGKTPVLLRLVSDLRAMGRRPFVLTRGYAGVGAPARSGIVRSPADAVAFSDEVRLMAELLPNVPIGVGADRVASAETVLAGGHEDVAVLDDGFQHWRVARDLDIVCIDATNPWGGGYLFPMGRLREPRSGLARAGLVLVTRCEGVPVARAQRVVDEVRRASPEAMVLCSRFSLSLVSTDGRPAAAPVRALAVSAIGNPKAFEENLKTLGVETVAARFGDHHAYTGDDWSDIRARARAAGVPVVTTAKDWVKLRVFEAHGDPHAILIAVQSLSYDDDGAWDRRVRAVLAGK